MFGPSCDWRSPWLRWWPAVQLRYDQHSPAKPAVPNPQPRLQLPIRPLPVAAAVSKGGIEVEGAHRALEEHRGQRWHGNDEHGHQKAETALLQRLGGEAFGGVAGDGVDGGGGPQRGGHAQGQLQCQRTDKASTAIEK